MGIGQCWSGGLAQVHKGTASDCPMLQSDVATAVNIGRAGLVTSLGCVPEFISTLACRCVGTRAQMWLCLCLHVLALVALAKTCCARVHVVSASRFRPRPKALAGVMFRIIVQSRFSALMVMLPCSSLSRSLRLCHKFEIRLVARWVAAFTPVRARHFTSNFMLATERGRESRVAILAQVNPPLPCGGTRGRPFGSAG